MMSRLAILAGLLAASAFSPAVASGAGAAADSSDAAEKVVCRREVPTGSVMAKKVCRTRGEWNTIAEQAQESRRRTQDMDRSRSMVAPTKGG